jgi:hypothetical protein
MSRRKSSLEQRQALSSDSASPLRFLTEFDPTSLRARYNQCRVAFNFLILAIILVIPHVFVQQAFQEPHVFSNDAVSHPMNIE